MSAEVLRRAVERMQADAKECGDAPSDFVPSVASWLSVQWRTAAEAERFGDYDERRWMGALTIARAYLGDDA